MQRAGLSIMPVPSPGKRDKTRCASFISLSRRSPHTNTSYSAATHRTRKRDKTRCASFISLSRRSPHTNTSHSAAAHRSRKRDKTRCASFISLSRRSPHTNTSHSAAAHCSRKLRTAHEVIMRRLFIAALGKKLLCESLRLSQLLFSWLAAEIKCPILYGNSLCLQFLPNEFDCML